MVDSYRVANALSALGTGLDQYAGMQQKQEQFQQEQAMMDRREAANRQFQMTLEGLRAAQTKQLHEEQMAQQKGEFAQTLEVHKDELARQTARDQQEAGFRNAQLGIENSRLGIEASRVGLERERMQDNKQITALNGRLSNISRTMNAYSAARDKEKANLGKDMNFQLLDDAQRNQRLSAIDKKYQPLIDRAQTEYDAYNKRFSDLTGVDFGASQQTPSTSTTGNAQDTDDEGMPAAPSGVPSSPVAPGSMPPNPNGVADPTQDPALMGMVKARGGSISGQPQPKYPDGTKLTGPGGKPYTVKNGIPVPDDATSGN